MGVFKLMEDPTNPLSKLPLAAASPRLTRTPACRPLPHVLRDFSMGKSDPALNDPAVNKSVWKKIVATADEYYRPGEFTTFPAFEWSSNPADAQSAPRRSCSEIPANMPEMALSSLDSTDPEHLWAWMGEQREQGRDPARHPP